MSQTVYVTHSSGSVRRQGELIELVPTPSSNERAEKTVVRPEEVTQLVLLGNWVVTPAALDLLLRFGIDVVYLTSNGRYRGRVIAGFGANAKLRIKQMQFLCEPAQQKNIAKSVVIGKLHNQQNLLRRHAHRHHDEEVRVAALGLQAAIRRAQTAESLDELRGCEGSGAVTYFRGLGAAIRAEGFVFEGRNRRPPQDPINALLSFGYTLLFNAVEASIWVVGLDPYIGALHALETGRASLACDLVEEFRAPCIDALMVAAINKRVFQPNHFEFGSGEGVVLKPEARGTWIRLFEKRMAETASYQVRSTTLKLPFKQIILHQVRRFARTVLGEEPTYETFNY